MLKGNVKIQCWKTQRNDYAEVELGGAFSESGWVVDISSKREHTSIRTDASGSRGRADMNTGELKLLLEVGTNLRRLDVVQPFGYLDRYQIDLVRPRLDTSGRLDHYEAVCSIWQG